MDATVPSHPRPEIYSRSYLAGSGVSSSDDPEFCSEGGVVNFLSQHPEVTVRATSYTHLTQFVWG
jgi:hypothetical protein